MCNQPVDLKAGKWCPASYVSWLTHFAQVKASLPQFLCSVYEQYLQLFAFAVIWYFCEKGPVFAEYFLFMESWGFINTVATSVFWISENLKPINFIVDVYDIYNILNFLEIIARWNEMRLTSNISIL